MCSPKGKLGSQCGRMGSVTGSARILEGARIAAFSARNFRESIHHHRGTPPLSVCCLLRSQSKTSYGVYHFFGGKQKKRFLGWHICRMKLPPRFLLFDLHSVHGTSSRAPFRTSLRRSAFPISAMQLHDRSRRTMNENAPTCYRAPKWPDPEFPRKIPKNTPRPEILDSRNLHPKYPENTEKIP